MSEIKNDQVADILPCGIFSFNERGTLIDVNHYLLIQLNYTAEELSGKHVENMLTLSSRIFFQTHFFPLLQLQGDVNEIFLTLRGKNSINLPVLLNAHKVEKNGNRLNVCACIVVNQRKKYEDEILHAKKVAEETLEKNEFLQQAKQQLEVSNRQLDLQMKILKHTNAELLQLNDIVAHDLQEPVRKILMFADMIKTNLSNRFDSKTAGNFEAINRSATKIRKVLHGLQEYMTLLTRKTAWQPVKLNEVLADEEVRMRKEFADVDFELSFDELPTIEGDIVQLRILFHELLTNCLEHRDEQRMLQIEVKGAIVEENIYSELSEKYEYAEFLKITITDNGMGFKPQYKDLVFKILKRLDQNRQSLGFGLAYCRQIVKNHLGNITADSELNRGTKMEVSLPVLQRVL